MAAVVARTATAAQVLQVQVGLNNAHHPEPTTTPTSCTEQYHKPTQTKVKIVIVTVSCICERYNYGQLLVACIMFACLLAVYKRLNG